MQGMMNAVGIASLLLRGTSGQPLPEQNRLPGNVGNKSGGAPTPTLLSNINPSPSRALTSNTGSKVPSHANPTLSGNRTQTGNSTNDWWSNTTAYAALLDMEPEQIDTLRDQLLQNPSQYYSLTPNSTGTNSQLRDCYFNPNMTSSVGDRCTLTDSILDGECTIEDRVVITNSLIIGKAHLGQSTEMRDTLLKEGANLGRENDIANAQSDIPVTAGPFCDILSAYIIGLNPNDQVVMDTNADIHSSKIQGDVKLEGDTRLDNSLVVGYCNLGFGTRLSSVEPGVKLAFNGLTTGINVALNPNVMAENSDVINANSKLVSILGETVRVFKPNLQIDLIEGKLHFSTPYELSEAPSAQASDTPSTAPSGSPSQSPSQSTEPSNHPTQADSQAPSSSPSDSDAPTTSPTSSAPTSAPTKEQGCKEPGFDWLTPLLTGVAGVVVGSLGTLAVQRLLGGGDDVLGEMGPGMFDNSVDNV